MQTINRHVCFDLEDTLIAPVMSGWHNWEPILENCRRFKEWILEHKPESVNIFSFAIHDNHELQQFDRWTRPYLEDLLGCQFLFVPTVLDGKASIRHSCARHNAMNAELITFSDMVEFWGKQTSFLFWARKFGTAQGGNTWVDLFDDAVEDSVHHFPNRGLTLELHHVAA